MAFLVVVLGMGFFLLNVLAVYQIILKAGYSGTWILLVLAPFASYLIGLSALIDDIDSRNFHAGSFAAWFGLAAFLAFVEYIFFLVFAFSEWPSLRQRRQSPPPGNGNGGYDYVAPGPPRPGRPGMAHARGGNSARIADQPSSLRTVPGTWLRRQATSWSEPWERPRGQAPTTEVSEPANGGESDRIP